jgi:signal transduction histidine kinase
MDRLKAFIKRNNLWAGFVVAFVPLLIILALQYWSLVRLEKLSPVADKWKLKDFLWTLSTEIQDYYQTHAKKILNIPPHAFKQDTDITPYAIQHFKKHDWEGASRLFVVNFALDDDHQVLFYDRSSHVLEAQPDCPDTRSVNVSCAPWKILSREGMTMADRKLSGMMTDQKNRVLIYPITDEHTRLIGMAGMLVDIGYFKERYLPKSIENSVSRFFTSRERDNVIVTVHDASNKLVLASQPLEDQDDEVSMSMPYIFKDWRLGIRSRYVTPEQWAHRYFALNLSLSILMTLVLIGGIMLSLRTASRQMKLSQMKADFVSNVSHELRTPIASIRVFGEFLKLGRVKESDKIREYGAYIENESRRLTQLINNILDFSKIESLQKKYAFEKADLEEVVQEAVRTFDVRLKQDGFSLMFQPAEAPLPPVVVDRDAIGQAFINLLDNAVKYSGSSKEIRVEVGQQNGWVSFSVVDHGIGIPREEQQKIFEKFYRVSTGLVHDVKGSGLGLALVKHIVEAHRGKVTVQSQPGQGAVFTVSLPATQIQQSLAPAESESSLGEPDSPLGVGVKS